MCSDAFRLLLSLLLLFVYFILFLLAIPGLLASLFAFYSNLKGINNWLVFDDLNFLVPIHSGTAINGTHITEQSVL